MKKVISVVLLATMLAATFVGCGSSSTGSSSASASVSKTYIGTTIYKFDDTFMSGVRDQISKSATADGTKVDISDSQNSTATQNNNIDLYISKKATALAINPVDPTASETIISKAKAANIPVVFFNRIPSDADMKSWDKLYYVGAKPEQSGTMQGQLMAKYWKSNPAADKNHDGVMDYVMITGEPGNSDAIARTKYSIDELNKEGIKTHLVATDTGMWDRVTAQNKMQSIVAAKGDQIEAVFANNDDMALGCISALKSAGYFTGGKYMPVVGVDATAPGLQAIQDGSLLGTVLNDAKNQAIATYKIAKVLSEGKVPSKSNIGYAVLNGKYVWIDYKPITKDNIKDAK